MTLYSSRCLRSAMRSSKPLATLCIVVAIVLMLVLRDRLHRKAEITVQGILADSERPTEAEELTLIRRTSVDKVRLVRGKRLGLYIYLLQLGLLDQRQQLCVIFGLA